MKTKILILFTFLFVGYSYAQIVSCDFNAKGVQEKEEYAIPFQVVEEKPKFMACEDVSKEKEAECFKEQLNKHVIRYFYYPKEAIDKGIEGRININFQINTNGSVTVIGVRGTDKLLETVAKEIIEKLPTFIPGKQGGKPVPVTFNYPINFKLTYKN
ncbi:TonB family protein [Capnocytophaga genosp. AHN8471]|jgi:tonB family C-terminal domain|uniref:TonB family protein n=1 Tax=Capnocytophaga genosp. AHN8471 TaxID=327574 RepID=A0ABS1YXX5_9FLAO|nr:TonB family protein [Capnocytophaga genosp. AHN8471]MBM0651263.1 TonB family protein [Capnocytophaga genosp. AHN8471]MBM0663346.1 TonB family protein [Capnocytophaga genosp. AHN8471]